MEDPDSGGMQEAVAFAHAFPILRYYSPRVEDAVGIVLVP